MIQEFTLVIPFLLLLLLIAIAPLFFPDWWLKHYTKVSFGLGAIVIVYYIFILDNSLHV